jgi:hypothetical protein
MADLTIGQVAYEAYRKTTINMLPWADLSPDQRQTWEEVASAVVEVTGGGDLL